MNLWRNLDELLDFLVRYVIGSFEKGRLDHLFYSWTVLVELILEELEELIGRRCGLLLMVRLNLLELRFSCSLLSASEERSSLDMLTDFIFTSISSASPVVTLFMLTFRRPLSSILKLIVTRCWPLGAG